MIFLKLLSRNACFYNGPHDHLPYKVDVHVSPSKRNSTAGSLRQCTVLFLAISGSFRTVGYRFASYLSIWLVSVQGHFQTGILHEYVRAILVALAES